MSKLPAGRLARVWPDVWCCDREVLAPGEAVAVVVGPL